MYTQRRMALKRQLPSTLTTEQWNIIKEAFNNKCCYCNLEKPLTQDHFLALNNGGPYVADNILPACKSCNSSKRDKQFFTWYPKYKHYSSEREQKILAYLGYIKGIQQLSLM